MMFPLECLDFGYEPDGTVPRFFVQMWNVFVAAVSGVLHDDLCSDRGACVQQGDGASSYLVRSAQLALVTRGNNFETIHVHSVANWRGAFSPIAGSDESSDGVGAAWGSGEDGDKFTGAYSIIEFSESLIVEDVVCVSTPLDGVIVDELCFESTLAQEDGYAVTSLIASREEHEDLFGRASEVAFAASCGTCVGCDGVGGCGQRKGGDLFIGSGAWGNTRRVISFRRWSESG